MKNEFYFAWIEQIYKRDTFYLYILAIVGTGFLWFQILRLWRFFKLVVVSMLIIGGSGIIWGLTQL